MWKKKYVIINLNVKIKFSNMHEQILHDLAFWSFVLWCIIKEVLNFEFLSDKSGFFSFIFVRTDVKIYLIWL